MTPVDDTSTCSAGQPSAAPVSAAVACAVSSPWLPVQAFAQPLFTITARTCPRAAARLRARHLHRRRLHLIRREERRGGRGSIRDDQRHVERARPP